MRPDAAVLKRDHVKMAGTCRLGCGDPVPAQADRANARILSQDAESAMVEVTCPCGQKIHLQCTYAAPEQK